VEASHACAPKTAMSTYTNLHSALEGGVLEVIFILGESSLGLKLSLYPKFQLHMCLGTYLKVCGGGWVVVLKPNLVFCFRPSFSFSLA
jgi:hypothetical protein